MTVQSLLPEPGRLNEPQAAQDYSDMFSQVVAHGMPVIIRRNGEDLAAVIPMNHMHLLREVLLQEELEKTAMQINWERVSKSLRPPQEWFDDNDNPFEPEELRT